jgi:hypothetical protein
MSFYLLFWEKNICPVEEQDLFLSSRLTYKVVIKEVMEIFMDVSEIKAVYIN